MAFDVRFDSTCEASPCLFTSELNRYERCRASFMKTLGGDEASWEDETDAPDSNDKYWQNLTKNQCTAATKLGYGQSCWDED